MQNMQFPSLLVLPKHTVPLTTPVCVQHLCCCGVITWEHVDAQAEVCNYGVSGDVQPVFVLENCFLFTRCKNSLTALQKSLHLLLHFLSRCVLVLCGGAHKGKGEACECNRLSQITQQLPKRCGRSHRARALNHSVSDKDQHCALWVRFLTYSDFHCAISSLGHSPLLT